MSLPILGITIYGRNSIGDFTLPATYVNAVRQAGALPVLLPPVQGDPTALLERLDGLILAGGGDIDPQHYGGSQHPLLYGLDCDRDAFELALVRHALNLNLPILGICRGMQVLSIATGATLIPHVPDVYGEQVLHRLDQPRRPVEHSVSVEPTSRLAQILGATEVTVSSWHHQAVQQISDCWQPVAYAADGLIEALEHRHHPWLVAVQWHPELSPDNPAQQRLFGALAAAATRYRASLGSTLGISSSGNSGIPLAATNYSSSSQPSFLQKEP
ncbi:MAG TPA: gamma-glutamyl-gamma-aminobutyrate hydrolase family protein [Trichocoleus sp.]